MEPKSLSRATALKVVAAVCSFVGMVTVTKSGGAWTALGLLFDGLRFLGFKVPSGADVVGAFAQTLPVVPGVKTPVSTVMLLPDTELEPAALAELYVHEGTHGWQSTHDKAWAVKYLQHREYRTGTAEGPAFGGGLALRWALTHTLPDSLDSFTHLFREGYDAQDHDIVGHDVIELTATEIAFGVIRNPVARVAIATIYREQPDAIHPESLRLMQANCPSALVVPA